MTSENFNSLVELTIANDLANPLSGRHAARWARIREIDSRLKSISAANTPLYKSRRRATPGTVPYNETEEWKTLVHEGTLLEAVEREHALNQDWPIWQDGQHFRYLDAAGNIREGEVIWFDLDLGTIHCSTWPLHDFAGYINQNGARTIETIFVQQIHDATQREEEIEAAKKAAATERTLIEERSRLPLFADQLMS